MITYIGLGLIIIAWGIYVLGIHNARRLFPAVYALGVLLLVAEGLRIGPDAATWLNLIVLVLVIAAIIKSSWKSTSA